jgi:peptidoglycan hydrolase CwlO-like protein
LRHQQEGLREARNLKRNTSDASKDVLIEALKNKIDNLNRKVNSLEVENQHLKDQIKKNLGKVYEDL